MYFSFFLLFHMMQSNALTNEDDKVNDQILIKTKTNIKYKKNVIL